MTTNVRIWIVVLYPFSGGSADLQVVGVGWDERIQKLLVVDGGGDFLRQCFLFSIETFDIKGNCIVHKR